MCYCSGKPDPDTETTDAVETELSEPLIPIESHGARYNEGNLNPFNPLKQHGYPAAPI